MAGIDAGSIYSQIVLNLSDFNKKMKQAEEKAKGFANVWERSMEGIGSAGKKLTLGITAPMMIMGKQITAVGKEFGTSMSEVQAISGATGKELEQLEKAAREMGKTTKYSASESADALKYMAMAGWDTEQMLGGLDGVMNLAAASGEDLALVSDIVTDALTGFGMEASQATEFADLLASASSNSNTNVAMMGETFKYAAPIMGALGYSAEDAALAIGLMANAGIKGSQAGTTLRSAVTALADPSKEAAGLMKELGINITDAEGQMLPFNDVMVQMRESFAGLSEEQQAQAASTLFGKQAMSGMLAIVNASEEDFNKLSEATTNYNGTAKEMSEIMEDNLAGDLATMNSAMEEVFLTIMDKLEPALRDIVQSITNLINKIGELDEDTLEIIMKIGLVAAAIGPVLIILSGLMGLISKLTILLKGVISVGGLLLKGIFGIVSGLATAGKAIAAFAGISVGWVAAIAAGIVAAGVLIYKNWDKIKEAATNLVETVTEKWTNFKETTIETWNAIKDGITESFENIKETITTKVDEIITGITETWNNFKEGVSSVFEGIMNFMDDLFGELKEAMISSFEEQLEIVQEIFGSMIEVFEGIWEVIKGVFAGAIVLIADILTGDFEQLKEDIVKINEHLKEKIRDVWESIKDVLSNIVELIKTTIKNAFENTKILIESINNKIKEVVENIWNRIKDDVTNVVEGIKTAISNGFNTMKETVSNITETIKTTIINIWNSTLDWFNNLPGRLYEIATNAFTKMKEGVENTIETVVSSVKDLGNDIVTTLEELPEKLLQIGKDLMDGLAEGIKSAIMAPINAVKSVGEKIVGAARGIFDTHSPSRVFMGIGKDNMDGLAIGIKDNSYLAEKEARDAAERIIKAYKDVDTKAEVLIDVDEMKKAAAQIVSIGEDAEFMFRNKISDMNADSLEQTKYWLDNEYEYQKKIVEKKLETLLAGDRKANEEEIKATRERRQNLESNYNFAESLMNKQLDKMEELAKAGLNNSGIINHINDSIKDLSDSVGTNEEQLQNQFTIMALQEKKMVELNKQYIQLVKTLGESSDVTKQAKQAMKDAGDEYERTAYRVQELQNAIREEEINKVNETTDKIKSALKKRYEDAKELEEQSLRDEMKTLDNWKDNSIKAINEVYDSRIKRIDEVAEKQIKALEDEIKALDYAEKQKTAAEVDEEEKRKIASLEEALMFEHNEENKTAIQKELSKVRADREERIRKEKVEKQKEELRDKISQIQEDAKLEKERLESKRDREIENINMIYEYEQMDIERRLEANRLFYERKTQDAALQAEAEKMIINNQQEEIIELLHDYEPEYKQAGQSLGEKLADGFRPAINNMMKMLDDLNARIDETRNNQLSELIDSSSGGGSGRGGSITNSTSNNEFNFYSPKALSPAEQRREFEKSLRKLAVT